MQMLAHDDSRPEGDFLSQNDAGVSTARKALRHDWTREEIHGIYRQALPDLLF
jgi:hypothetical protein